ncbi:MAG: GAF domain-containing protein [Myxococcales bacterium]|nr:GAF domain-containing protein [Myxococcales bacterium]
MRWVVEVSSIGKTDLQKFCVEAESWQRALQAARAQRGEEGPMSGFSIELLEEGYRAVDPIARIRFVVKRAPDDMPVTAPLVSAKDGGKGVAPSPPSTAAAEPKVPPSPASSPASTTTTSSKPPRPVQADKGTNGSTKETSPASKAASATPATVVGSALPGLPPVKVLSSREQDPTDASPLTYREYSFAVPAGTSEDTAVAVLRGQLALVDALLTNAKMGKLVNLAAFDVEFTGKPPSPPIATLSWKDWKGEPVIGYPRRGAAQTQVKPPTAGGASNGPQSTAPPASSLFPPPSMPPSALQRPDAEPSVAPASAAPVAFPAPATVSPSSIPPAPQARPASVPPPAMAAPAPAHASVPPPDMAAPVPAHASVAPPAMAAPVPAHASGAPPAMVAPSQPPPAGVPVPVVAPVVTFQPAPPGGSVPPPANAGSVPPPAAAVVQPARRPSSPEGLAPRADGMVRTPSGRFVRGRTTGELFESMHDLHFLRDALDGGQFCLALATEVLPARAALIHFFDVEKREWVIACTRGKDTSRLLTLRTAESDELLRDAARKRRAIVTPNATEASAQRYQSLGGSRSMIIAPIMQAGRALGAIEIINPLDGMPFTEDEGNAMTYIAEQYAEYLGSRGIVLDRERIQNAATPR